MAINDLAANYVFPICTTLQDASAIVRKNLLIDREPPDLSDQLTVTSMCKLENCNCSNSKTVNSIREHLICYA